MLTGRTYDVFKWSSAVFVPALQGLWLTLATVWNLPLKEEISATIIGLNVFLGLITGISAAEYYKDRK